MPLMGAANCPALLIAAPASGQGKTSVTAGLARLAVRRGWRVQVFKCGPDFLDPHWHTLASGKPVHNLDLWLNGESDVRARLHAAAGANDLVLIEGVMGLFDGQPSSADLAQRFGIPVLAVVDAGAMAETFGAVVHGLRTYRAGLPWAGVLANRVASDGHLAMLRSSVSGARDGDADGASVGWLGGLRRSATLALPERHLGLTVASELPDAHTRLDALADALAETPLGRMTLVDLQRWSIRFPHVPRPAVTAALAGSRVAIARDAAHCFIYPSNVDTLKALGAEVVFVSPLADEPLPPCDALWLPGGYPELHAQALGGVARFRASLAAHIEAGRPVWAECGGMMPLFEGLTLADGTRCPMWGVLPGEVRMQARLAGLGPQRWDTTRGELRGHTFHYSLTESPLSPTTHTCSPNAPTRQEAVYEQGPVRASYFHAWFASCPDATASLFTGEAL